MALGMVSSAMDFYQPTRHPSRRRGIHDYSSTRCRWLAHETLVVAGTVVAAPKVTTALAAAAPSTSTPNFAAPANTLSGTATETPIAGSQAFHRIADFEQGGMPSWLDASFRTNFATSKPDVFSHSIATTGLSGIITLFGHDSGRLAKFTLPTEPIGLILARI